MTTNALALIIGILTLIGAVVAIVLAIAALRGRAVPVEEVDPASDAAGPDAPVGTQSEADQAHGYGLIPYVLTQTEQSFFQALCDATPEGLLVFPQVRLGGLVHPKARDRRRWHSDFNRIQANTVDFVLCDMQTTAPRLVIELDDSPHDKPSRRVRDAFVDRVLESAGLPVLRVRRQQAYHCEALAQLIYARLDLRQVSSSGHRQWWHQRTRRAAHPHRPRRSLRQRMRPASRPRSHISQGRLRR
jgi:very-short-patch-repair endonuclease